MENIPNGAFDKRLLSFPQSQYSTVLNQIISGIDFLHSNSIIHRDIKLENILYNEEKGTIKIIDFGLLKVLFPSETTSECCCGTVSYSAPEIREGKPILKQLIFGVLVYWHIFLNIRRNLLIMKNLIKTQLIEKYQLF